MKSNNFTETYGELLPESVTRLISEMSLTESDVFLDLGSGFGKVVTQIFLNTKVKKSIGIEINPMLHAAAEQVGEKIMRDFPGERKIQFIQGDFLKASLDGATVALIASPCYSPSMFYEMGKRINETPSIHAVFSLRPMATLSRLTFKKIIRLEGTWDTTLCYIYEA